MRELTFSATASVLNWFTEACADAHARARADVLLLGELLSRLVKGSPETTLLEIEGGSARHRETFEFLVPPE